MKGQGGIQCRPFFLLYLFVFTQFRTQNRCTFLLELL